MYTRSPKDFRFFALVRHSRASQAVDSVTRTVIGLPDISLYCPIRLMFRIQGGQGGQGEQNPGQGGQGERRGPPSFSNDFSLLWVPGPLKIPPKLRNFQKNRQF